MNLYDLHNKPDSLNGYNEIIKVPEFAYEYINENKYKKDARYNQALETISKSPEQAYKYAVYIYDKPWPPGEDAISKNAETAYYYCFTLMNEAWPKGEDAIATSGEYSMQYAIEMLNGPFPKGEQAILDEQNAETAYNYANWALNSRWLEAEPVIMKEPKWAFRYAKRVMKERWPEAEPYIKQEVKWWNMYKLTFRNAKPTVRSWE